MSQNTVYLEAAARTQDLLSIKWALKSAGYAIASTWHESETTSQPSGFPDRWNARVLKQLQICNSLIVLCGKTGAVIPELAMMAGFALAQGLRVIWIGNAVPGLSNFQGVRQFNTAEDFRKQILQQTHPQPLSVDERLAA
jgi:hypothetical protein